MVHTCREMYAGCYTDLRCSRSNPCYLRATTYHRYTECKMTYPYCFEIFPVDMVCIQLLLQRSRRDNVLLDTRNTPGLPKLSISSRTDTSNNCVVPSRFDIFRPRMVRMCCCCWKTVDGDQWGMKNILMIPRSLRSYLQGNSDKTIVLLQFDIFLVCKVCMNSQNPLRDSTHRSN